jgi:hypothetical protein
MIPRASFIDKTFSDIDSMKTLVVAELRASGIRFRHRRSVENCQNNRRTFESTVSLSDLIVYCHNSPLVGKLPSFRLRMRRLRTTGARSFFAKRSDVGVAH